MPMFDSFLAELLAASMLIFSCARIFFLKNAKIDSAVVVAPAAFIVSMLSFFVWGAELPIILLVLLSTLVLFTNLRALLRLASHLYIDHYSIVFTVFSIIELLLSCFMLILLFVFHPVNYSAKKLSVVRAREQLTGSAADGYEPSSSKENVNGIKKSFKKTGVLYSYTPAQKTETLEPILLFVPDTRATVLQYEPYLMLLAQRGYTVLAADLYDPDMKWFSSLNDNRLFRRTHAVLLSLNDAKKYLEFKKNTAAQVSKEYTALAQLAVERYGKNTKLFIIADGLDGGQIASIFRAYPKNVKGYYPLPLINEYKTSCYGFVEQTDLWLGHELGISRDSSLFIPRYAATKTIDVITGAAPAIPIPRRRRIVKKPAPQATDATAAEGTAITPDTAAPGTTADGAAAQSSSSAANGENGTPSEGSLSAAGEAQNADGTTDSGTAADSELYDDSTDSLSADDYEDITAPAAATDTATKSAATTATTTSAATTTQTTSATAKTPVTTTSAATSSGTTTTSSTVTTTATNAAASPTTTHTATTTSAAGASTATKTPATTTTSSASSSAAVPATTSTATPVVTTPAATATSTSSSSATTGTAQ